jgi:hypothetical protein
MKFRILKVVETRNQAHRFKPQFKRNGWFSRWRNISDTWWATSICNPYPEYVKDEYLNTYPKALEVLDKFKAHCETYRFSSEVVYATEISI